MSDSSSTRSLCSPPEAVLAPLRFPPHSISGLQARLCYNLPKGRSISPTREESSGDLPFLGIFRKRTASIVRRPSIIGDPPPIVHRATPLRQVFRLTDEFFALVIVTSSQRDVDISQQAIASSIKQFDDWMSVRLRSILLYFVPSSNLTTFQKKNLSRMKPEGRKGYALIPLSSHF